MKSAGLVKTAMPGDFAAAYTPAGVLGDDDDDDKEEEEGDCCCLLVA